jgi:magnesium-protoporphyrin IX monomethyl ester (oxidative) cyclase
MNALLDRLIDEKLGITWAAVSGLRINTLNKEIIEKIKAANCIRLNLAIESGDMKILKAMNKELNIDKIKEVVSMCNKAGIEPRGYLIIGYPGEDRESFYQTMQFCKELKQLGMKTFILSIAQPYPKTPLWKLCKEKNYLVKENIEDILFFSEYPEPNIITPEFDTQEIQFRFRYAMRYLNPVEYWGNRLLPRAWVKRIIPKEIKDMIIRHT